MYPGRPTGKGELQSPCKAQEDVRDRPDVHNGSDVTDRTEIVNLIYCTVCAHYCLSVAHNIKAGHAC